MKSKSIYLLLVIAGLVFLFYMMREKLPAGNRDASFSVKPGTAVTRIEMYQGDSRLTLTLEKGIWMVNKTDEARKSAIRFINEIIEGMKIKSPVSPGMFASEIIEKSIAPVKVSVYSKRRIVKSFLVYRTQSNTYGNMMKIKPSAKPYIVYLPGFENNIGSVFTTSELFWRPFSVFHHLPGEILSASVNYVSDPDASFEITNNRGVLSMKGDSGQLTGWDTAKVRRYISYFTSVPFESWAFDLADNERDSIKLQEPLCIISITTTNNAKKSLTVWEKYLRSDSLMVKDTDRAYGQKDQMDELVIVRYFDIDPVLKKSSYFFNE